MKLVVNSSPLIQLTACHRLELLQQLAGEVLVPNAVLRELRAGKQRDRVAETVAAAPWITFHEGLRLPQAVASWDLGAGESQVLAVAASREKSIAVLDDRAARNCARAIPVPHVGTLGILTAAKEHGLLSSLRPLIEELRRAGLYLSDQVIATVLRQAGE